MSSIILSTRVSVRYWNVFVHTCTLRKGWGLIDLSPFEPLIHNTYVKPLSLDTSYIQGVGNEKISSFDHTCGGGSLGVQVWGNVKWGKDGGIMCRGWKAGEEGRVGSGRGQVVGRREGEVGWLHQKIVTLPSNPTYGASPSVTPT